MGGIHSRRRLPRRGFRQPLKHFFFHIQAQDFHQHDIAKTYVAERITGDTAGRPRGFVTLIASEIDIRDGYVGDDPVHANRYASLPAVKLARLAVDGRFCVRRTGEALSLAPSPCATRIYKKSLTATINASTINHMETRPFWDEAKRQANLAKHGLDFADAGEVLGSRYRLDVPVVRKGEPRTMSISYALGFLAVLTVVHTERDDATRIISFRHASTMERRMYDDWLANQSHGAG